MMELTPQRVAIVLEHASATMDYDEEAQNDGNNWSVVAYLIMDSGERQRITLHRCQTRAEASKSLGKVWSDRLARHPHFSSAA